MATITQVTETYTVVMHEAEEGGYWGEVLELPGCVSQGETVEEFSNNIKEAIEAVLQAYMEGPRGVFQLEPTEATKETVYLTLSEGGDRLVSIFETNQTWTDTQ